MFEVHGLDAAVFVELGEEWKTGIRYLTFQN